VGAVNDKQYRQLIWVLLGKLGGRVVVSWREIGEAPRQPVVTVQATEAGFVITRPAPAGKTQEAS
jgi:hypothetical protein